jgi:hypothetical protein
MARQTDKNRSTRVAQRLIVEFRKPDATGAGGWQPYWDAEAVKVTLSAGMVPNTAEIRFPRLRWNDFVGFIWGTQIRIRTAVPMLRNGSPRYDQLQPAVLFQGFAVKRPVGWHGGDDKGGAHESSTILCLDYRWFINAGLSIYGQYARAYTDIKSTFTFFSGRRCIFNEKGKPNRDADAWTDGDLTFHLFGSDEYWTCRQMLSQILLQTLIRTHITEVAGLDNALDVSDLLATPHHVIIDTMPALEAILRIIGPLGWTLREEYTFNGPKWVFYKAGRARYDSRNAVALTILHDLWAPAPGELAPASAALGRKLVTGGRLVEDIAAAVNSPVGLGAPERYEATFNLVPGWKDADLVPDSSDDYANVFVAEADLQASIEPDAYSVYKYYHPLGSHFRRDVGRKWVLNEAGDYTAAPYGRGDIFDFQTVLPADRAINSHGFLWGPFRRKFLPCLTFEEGSVNSVGIKVELSMDGGTTWQELTAEIANLEGECGLRIESPNLSDILDKTNRDLSGGDLDGFELNYWTSLCRDKLAASTWPNWQTRIRVTASVQMDQRLRVAAAPTANSGSPFPQTRVFDFSDEYTYSLRTTSSQYSSSGLSAWDTDETEKLRARIEAIRDANEDKSVAGPVILDRLWLGDGTGEPEFKVGDGVRRFGGRWYDLGGTVRNDRVYPEIAQIVYDNQTQKQTLVLRDARFAQVELDYEGKP